MPPQRITNEPTITAKKFKQLLDCDIPRFIIWDIETAPIPIKDLQAFVDKKKIKYPDEPILTPYNKVKFGNMGADKKAEKWRKLQAEHATALATHPVDRIAAEEKYLEELYNKAALDSTTNTVLAIGYGVLMSDGSIAVYMDTGDESELTERLWYMVNRVMNTDGAFFTWNGDRFDIPVMTAKAWKHRISAPYLLTKYNKMHEVSVDGAKIFSCGNYQRYAKLDHAAKFFGVAGKLEGVTGDMFHKLYNGGQASRTKAMQYAWHDIDTTYRVLSMMRVLDAPLRVLQSHAKSQAKKGK
jgi:predicted PolB exonuclease-like 3'-5' exonuclease